MTAHAEAEKLWRDALEIADRMVRFDVEPRSAEAGAVWAAFRRGDADDADEALEALLSRRAAPTTRAA